jgi:hypothetical protein
VGALADYIADVQDLLHDPLAQMWSVAQVTRYINGARDRVAKDTKALRQVLTQAAFPTLQFAAGTDFFNPQTFLAPFLSTGNELVDVMGVTIIINQQRQSLIYKPYSWINARLRGWVGYQSYPGYWSRLSPIQCIIAPTPNISYPCEFDVSITPTKLVNDSTVDQLPAPFRGAVKYYASYLAKINQQSQGESQYFHGLYDQQLVSDSRSYMQRVIQNPYASSLE